MNKKINMKLLQKILKSIWFFLKYGILITIAGLIIILILISSAYKDLKNAGTAALSGKTEATKAAYAAVERDWAASLNSAQKSSQSFSLSLESLEKARKNPTIKKLKLLNKQINDLEYLVKTGEIISRSIINTIPIAEGLNNILAASPNRNFSDLPIEEKGIFLKLVYESEPELNGLKANLNLALLNLEKINKIGILWPVYKQISDIKEELRQAVFLMDKTAILVKLLPAIAGYPESSRFLLIMQNNDELRPSGGFIGVYGILETKNGEIISLKTDDSYHLDMPASLNDWNMEPPAPIKEYLKVKKWYLRDANWSPDWPTSAQKIEEIYNGETISIGQEAENFTGLIAITPDLIADFIKLVGSITVNGDTYDSENFQPLLQYNVEVAYKEQDISSWDRKNIINELVRELKVRLFNLPTDHLGELLKIIDKGIIAKDIQIYFKNGDWQNFNRELGASGEIRKTENDYLMVVDANLGAFKSDAVVKKKISHTISNGNDGLKASAHLNYRHEGDFDWRTTRYRSYTRIYAPLGSKFISLEGLDINSAGLSIEDDKNLDKTIFGFFWTTEPGTIQNVTVNYLLPERIKEKFSEGDYRLLVQRQSGSRIEGLQIIVNDLRKKPQIIDSNLDTDKFFEFSSK